MRPQRRPPTRTRRRFPKRVRFSRSCRRLGKLAADVETTGEYHVLLRVEAPRSSAAHPRVGWFFEVSWPFPRKVDSLLVYASTSPHAYSVSLLRLFHATGPLERGGLGHSNTLLRHRQLSPDAYLWSCPNRDPQEAQGKQNDGLQDTNNIFFRSLINGCTLSATLCRAPFVPWRFWMVPSSAYFQYWAKREQVRVGEPKKNPTASSGNFSLIWRST